MEKKRTTFGLDSFWETCDRDNVGDDPLERELCFRIDALTLYREQIEAAEEMGDDEAVTLLSRHYEDTRHTIQRLHEAIRAQKAEKATI